MSAIPDPKVIAARYGGEARGDTVYLPTPGHSSRDRGTAVRIAADAPDGLLVACYNGGRADALAVKDMLRRDGFLPPRSDTQALSLADRNAIRAQAERAESERKIKQHALHVNAARTVRERLANAKAATPCHPYLTRKNIGPDSLWQSGNELLVPMQDAAGVVWNCQRIFPGGFKCFHKSARVTGLFWRCGEIGVTLSESRAVIGEGMATMAAIRRATGLPVIAALSAQNLLPVAQSLRERNPRLQIIIAADDDWHLAVNIGVEAAHRAARAIGGLVATPPPTSTQTPSMGRGTDFADLSANVIHARFGIEAANA